MESKHPHVSSSSVRTLKLCIHPHTSVHVGLHTYCWRLYVHLHLHFSAHSHVHPYCRVVVHWVGVHADVHTCVHGIGLNSEGREPNLQVNCWHDFGTPIGRSVEDIADWDEGIDKNRLSDDGQI